MNKKPLYAQACQPRSRLRGLWTFRGAAEETEAERGRGNSRVWVGVARPRRLLRRLGVEAGDDMLLWYLRHKDKLALSRPNTRLRVIWKSVHRNRSGVELA